jgi:hypothetical protein
MAIGKSAEEWRIIIDRIQKRIAAGETALGATRKEGVSDGAYRLAAKRLGINITPLRREPKIEEDRAQIAQIESLVNQGMRVADAATKVGLTPGKYYGAINRIAKADEAAPEKMETPKKEGKKKEIQMMQINMGKPVQEPTVVMSGNAEDLKAILGTLNSILKG